MARMSGLLWPADLTQPAQDVPVFALPPLVHAGFVPAGQFTGRDFNGVEVPEAYVLYHGPHDKVALHRVLEVWTWVAEAVGEWFPLVLLGLDRDAEAYVRALAGSSSIWETLRILPPLLPADVISIYQGCVALLHPTPANPWDGTLRQALACGCPVVDVHEVHTEAIVGEAAYLLPENDLRGMGAALITVLGEESVAGPLRGAALKRAAAWRENDFAAALLAAYIQVLG
jgi:glycosyltransferase involved in cell wall biosynthesis